MKLQVLGIDLGKTVFYLVGVDSTGTVVNPLTHTRVDGLSYTAGKSDTP